MKLKHEAAAKFHAVQSLFDHLSLYVFTVALGACPVHKLHFSMHSGLCDDSGLPRFSLVMIKYELSLVQMPVGRGGRDERRGQTIRKTLGAGIRETSPYLTSTPASEIQSVSLAQKNMLKMNISRI